jgi:hypothetical protein
MNRRASGQAKTLQEIQNHNGSGVYDFSVADFLGDYGEMESQRPQPDEALVKISIYLTSVHRLPRKICGRATRCESLSSA